MKKFLFITAEILLIAVFLFAGGKVFTELRQRQRSAEIFDQAEELIAHTPDVPEIAPSTTVSENEKVEFHKVLSSYEKYIGVYDENPDFVGWISIEGTRVNYPVMHTPDRPNFYLRRAFDGSYNDCGVPYLQENCDAESSDNLIFYGHNMKNESMFADLCKYEDEEFLKAHPIIQFDTLSDYGSYEVLAVIKTEPEDFRYFEFVNADSEEEFNAFIESCKELSLHDTGVRASYGDRLITLSTCEDSISQSGRMVIVARLSQSE